MLTGVIKIFQRREAHISLRRKTLGFSQLEAGLYALMVGCSETFALYYAVKRGIAQQDFAVISSVPILLGAIANWLIPQFVPTRFVKHALLLTVFTQICGLAGLFHSVGAENHFAWILISLSLYWIGGLAANPLWIDWMSGWLPQERLSRYLSRRNGFVALMTVIAYLLAAVWIHQSSSIRMRFHQLCVQLGVQLKLRRTSHQSRLICWSLPTDSVATRSAYSSQTQTMRGSGRPFS